MLVGSRNRSNEDVLHWDWILKGVDRGRSTWNRYSDLIFSIFIWWMRKKTRKAHRIRGNLNGGWFKLFGSKPELLNDNQFEVTVMNIFHLDFRMPNAASVLRKKSKYSVRWRGETFSSMKRTADSLAYLEIDFSLNVRIKVAWLHRNQIVAHAITGSDYIILRRLFSAKSFPFNSLEFRTFYCIIILIKISILPIWIDISVSVSLKEEKKYNKMF